VDESLPPNSMLLEPAPRALDVLIDRELDRP
jgi:hypothetical protein